MIEKTKKNLVCSILLLSLISVFFMYSITVPLTHATEEQTNDKGLSVLNDVIGVDLTKYAATSKECVELNEDVIPQENIRYTLEGNGTKLDMFCIFVNGEIQRIQVLEKTGTPQMTKTAPDTFGMAKQFLADYQVYTNNSLYGELESILNAADTNKNSTTTLNNINLEVTTSTESTTLRWTYTFNGVKAPDKCVALRYKNGFLKYFIDNWGMYQIGNTNFKISEQEAIEIAMTHAKTYSLKTKLDTEQVEIKFNVTNAMIWETKFASSLYVDNAHSDNKLELYPMYHVWVSLDKFYPGNIYGFNVYVWADTGEIAYFKERVTTADPPAELVASFEDITSNASNENQATDALQQDSTLPSGLALMTVTLIMVLVVPAYLAKKKQPRISFNLQKLRSLKVKGIMICIILLSSSLAFSAITVNASGYKGRATIWGSESAGSYVEVLKSSWRKTRNETLQQRETAQLITYLFQGNGYVSTNCQGENGTTSHSGEIVAQIADNELNYEHVAVVDFDHGNGRNDSLWAPLGEFHYMFEDQDGTITGEPSSGVLHTENAVYDMNISQMTILGNNTFFVLISACNSAHVDDAFYGGPISEQGIIPGTDRARGMPYAWTHQKVTENPTCYPLSGEMSSDGYEYPDEGEFCYMGFFGGSAALNQTINGTAPAYHLWLEEFFDTALSNDITINAALDIASQECWTQDFDETALYQNFTAIWPIYSNNTWEDFTGDGKLKVYGNGNIKLYQPRLTVNSYTGVTPLPTSVIIDGMSVGPTSVSARVTGYPDEMHTIEVSEPEGYTFHHFTLGVNTYETNPVSIPVESDMSISAFFTADPPLPDIPVTVIIDSVPYDGYVRYHALTCDESIPTVFWNGDWYSQHHDAIIGVTGSTFHYEKTYYVTEGYHNIEYAISCWVGYWHATITVGGQIVAEQDSDVYNHVSAQIYASQGGPPPSYDLTISYGSSGGYTSPSQGQYPYAQGTPVQVTAYPDGLYQFAYWLLDGNPQYQNPITVTMNSNHNLQAYFEQQYRLIISAGTGGSTNPSPATYWYSPGTPVQISANPSGGYTFDYWTLDSNPQYQNPITVTMNSNHEIHANFEQITHQVTVYCYDEYYNPGEIPLYIDSQYVGLTMHTYTVTEDTHSFQVADSFPGYTLYGWWYSGYWYSNPLVIGVYSNIEIYAYYVVS